MTIKCSGNETGLERIRIIEENISNTHDGTVTVVLYAGNRNENDDEIFCLKHEIKEDAMYVNFPRLCTNQQSKANSCHSVEGLGLTRFQIPNLLNWYSYGSKKLFLYLDLVRIIPEDQYLEF